MYEVPPCPCCALKHIVCATCKADKPKGPSGIWIGSWWYCNQECGKTPAPIGEYCSTHRAARERLRISHPHLFP